MTPTIPLTLPATYRTHPTSSVSSMRKTPKNPHPSSKKHQYVHHRHCRYQRRLDLRQYQTRKRRIPNYDQHHRRMRHRRSSHDYRWMGCPINSPLTPTVRCRTTPDQRPRIPPLDGLLRRRLQHTPPDEGLQLLPAAKHRPPPPLPQRPDVRLPNAPSR